MDTFDDVLAAIDAFDNAPRTRDRVAAEAVWCLDRDDVLIETTSRYFGQRQGRNSSAETP